MDDPIKEVEQENAEAVSRANEREMDDGDDEVLPPDPNGFAPKEDDHDELKDNAVMRNAMYYLLKDTRGEPGLSIENVARTIISAWSREEVAALTSQLTKFQDS